MSRGEGGGGGGGEGQVVCIFWRALSPLIPVAEFSCLVGTISQQQFLTVQLRKTSKALSDNASIR